MTYKSALFLFNGNTEEKELTRSLIQILPKLAKGIEQLSVIQTTSVQHLYEACENYAEKVDLVIILGGDGTVHECVNAISHLKHRPVLGILPGGTCNDFSRMLSIPQNLNQAVDTILEGKTKVVDIGKSSDRYFLNFWGVGLVTKASINRDEEKKKRLGVLSYFLSAMKTMTKAEPFSYRVTADGEVLEGTAIMIMVLNGKIVGTQEIPISDIDPGDGKLDLLIVKNSSFNLFKEIMQIGKEDAAVSILDELVHIQAQEIKIETGEEKEIDVDGEISSSTPASLSILPNYLEVIYKEK